MDNKHNHVERFNTLYDALESEYRRQEEAYQAIRREGIYDGDALIATLHIMNAIQRILKRANCPPIKMR